jgi:hypothetical protein
MARAMSERAPRAQYTRSLGEFEFMNMYDRAVADAKLGIKALQNMATCVKYFELMAATRDQWMLSSLFCAGVVRYGRPFSQPAAGRGNRAYPEKHLKRRPGFRQDVHEHLIGIRNTLVAHDDIESIEPKLLTTGATVGDSFLMATISVSNKCLAYPIEGATMALMLEQARICAAGIDAKLADDLVRVRDECQRDPDTTRAGSKFSQSGEATLSQGQAVAVPDFTQHPWFTPDHPNFSAVHNGFKIVRRSLTISCICAVRYSTHSCSTSSPKARQRPHGFAASSARTFKTHTVGRFATYAGERLNTWSQSRLNRSSNGSARRAPSL